MKHKLTIGWLYPSLMSTYGDRGNIICLKKRCNWRGIDVEIVPIEKETSYGRLKSIDLLFGGGAQDREQNIVIDDLKGRKAETIKTMIEHNMPSLFVCGSPQIMGKFYEPGIGQRIEGLGIFDIETVHPGLTVPRCIGNIVAEVAWQNLSVPASYKLSATTYIVGFENHGGRTTLGKNAKPFATVIKGFGNNGGDKTEGVVYKNAIGCYFHGPLLPKNPHIADFLITKALQIKYEKDITLSSLDDSLEWQAHHAIVKRLGITL